MQLNGEALGVLLGAIPGSCAAEWGDILVGFSHREVEIPGQIGGRGSATAVGNCRLLFV